MIRDTRPATGAGESARSLLLCDPDGSDVELAGGGDRLAFARLMARNAQRISRTAERLLGSVSEAQDVTQEVFLKAWQQAPHWRSGEARFSTWLYRVALSRCSDRLRKRRELPLECVAEPSGPDGSLEARLQQQAVAQRLRQALTALPERQRQAIVLRHYEELSNLQAAAVLALSVDALESLLARGRRKLKATLLTEREALSGDSP